MKHKAKIVACCLAAVLVCALAGCRLAREEDGLYGQEDRLVGVFLTTEYLDLFDFEGYLQDNAASFPGGEIAIDGDAAKKYQGRLYATLTKKTLTGEGGETLETDEYVFEGVDGIPYFCVRVPATAERASYIATESDEAVSDGQTKLNYGDEANSAALEGTIHVSPCGRDRTYYFNPVYQSADGRVYATAGSGFSVGGIQDEGALYSQTMEAAYATTENGKTAKDSISVKLSLSVMHPPEKIVILQMDGDSSVVSRAQYAPGEVPETMIPAQNVQYIVVETHKSDGQGNAQTSRQLYGPDAESLETFSVREDGVCVKRWTQIQWPGREDRAYSRRGPSTPNSLWTYLGILATTTA